MNGFSQEFGDKLGSIGFRSNDAGLAMVANVSGVEVTAMESPLAIHLMFTQITARTATQYEETMPTESTAQQIAAFIVENMRMNFPNVAKGPQR